MSITIINNNQEREASMTKKLTLDQVNKKIDDLECSYYKGWKMGEYEWRFSGRVSQIDLMYWGRLHKIKRKITKKRGRNEKKNK